MLSSCSHAGFVDDGLRHFDAMSKLHGVAIGVEQYGCIEHTAAKPLTES
jgi:hypothetical protein